MSGRTFAFRVHCGLMLPPVHNDDQKKKEACRR